MAWPEERGNGEFPWTVVFRIGTLPNGRPQYKRVSGFPDRETALNHGLDQEADLRRGTWHDDRKGDLTLDDYFWHKWLPAQDIGDDTRHGRAGEYRTHIAPRWGKKPLNAIDTFDVMAFEKHMKATRSASTAGNVLGLLRFMLEDAAHAELIKKSPMLPRQRARRGQKTPTAVRIGKVTTIEQVLAIGERLKPGDALMALVALFTGMRWAEVAGMRRSFLTLGSGADATSAPAVYVIDPEVGALHEERSGRRFYGPPKGAKGRDVELPGFLAELLAAHLETFPKKRDALFVNSRGQTHNHSSFINNHWRQACDGWPERAYETPSRGRGRWARPAAPAVHEGLWFHDLRHTHKTFLADDGIEPRARDERLGHETPGMDGTYIHVTARMRARVLEALSARWEATRSAPTSVLPEALF